MGINDYLFLGVIIMFCILWFIDVFIKLKYKLNKPPKFRKSIDGNEDIEFYSEFYKEWKKFCIWNDYDNVRVIHIHDTIHNIEFDYEYTGKGRSYIIYREDTLNKYCSKFKTIKELDDDQNNLIDKENEYLKEILNDRL